MRGTLAVEEMHTTVAVGLTCVAGVGFLINFWLGLGGFRDAGTREESLEASGALIPALGWVLVAMPSWILRGWFCIFVIFLGFFLVVLGRAGYEWLVLDILRGKRQTQRKRAANQRMQR